MNLVSDKQSTLKTLRILSNPFCFTLPLCPISYLHLALLFHLLNMKLSVFTSVAALAGGTFAASLEQVTDYGSNPSNVSLNL